MTSVRRFITEDSYNRTHTDPLSQNRYVYAEDNPMRYVDPMGHVIVAVGSGGGTTSTQTTPTPMDEADWIPKVYIPSHLVQLATTVVGGITLVWDPALGSYMGYTSLRLRSMCWPKACWR
ncbi:MAG: hypothetical protein JRN21_02575 [Nitrososphaerota archaeon]|nr:hypothetical protein [Nitrososphaerota archaeon]